MNDEANFDPHDPNTFGPQGAHVVALLERARHLTPDEASALDTAWDNALGDALDDASDAAWDAAEAASLDAALAAVEEAAALDDALDDALYAVRDAAGALVVRDLIATDHYDTLTRAWRTAIGPIHPEDELWAAVAKAAK